MTPPVLFVLRASRQRSTPRGPGTAMPLGTGVVAGALNKGSTVLASDIQMISEGTSWTLLRAVVQSPGDGFAIRNT